jgi:hypothetical protein
MLHFFGTVRLLDHSLNGTGQCVEQSWGNVWPNVAQHLADIPTSRSSGAHFADLCPETASWRSRLPCALPTSSLPIPTFPNPPSLIGRCLPSSVSRLSINIVLNGFYCETEISTMESLFDPTDVPRPPPLHALAPPAAEPRSRTLSHRLPASPYRGHGHFPYTAHVSSTPWPFVMAITESLCVFLIIDIVFKGGGGLTIALPGVC